MGAGRLLKACAATVVLVVSVGLPVACSSVPDVFFGDVEYVIEAIAPPEDYGLVERRVMNPLLDSLELEGEVTEATG